MYVYRVRDAREFKETILETDQGDSSRRRRVWFWCRFDKLQKKSENKLGLIFLGGDPVGNCLDTRGSESRIWDKPIVTIYKSVAAPHCVIVRRHKGASYKSRRGLPVYTRRITSEGHGRQNCRPTGVCGGRGVSLYFLFILFPSLLLHDAEVRAATRRRQRAEPSFQARRQAGRDR
jgi:hypothetical protein